MKVLNFIPALLMVVAGSFAQAATAVFVQETSSAVAHEEAGAIHDLIKASLGEVTDYQIVETAADAKITLKPKLLKLGNAFMVTLEKSEGGKIKFSSQLKADKAEELDIVCRRLTRAVLEEKAPQSDLKVQEVTSAEMNRGINRKEVIRRWILGFGPTGVANLNTNTTQFGYLIGYTWEMAEPAARIKAFLDSTTGFSDFAIGADYFFSQRDTSLLAGADLGYGATAIQNGSGITNTNVSGFIGGVDVGVAFFRTSKVNLELRGRYATLVATNSYGTPSLFGVRLAVLF